MLQTFKEFGYLTLAMDIFGKHIKSYSRVKSGNIIKTKHYMHNGQIYQTKHCTARPRFLPSHA